ncbi:MAG: DUF1501 domain-containing protein [Planctomycetota bacterium]|nr:DUF1501 domain-containing protein [Planctomycetota bacterium]
MTTPFIHAWTDPRGNVGRRDFVKQLAVGGGMLGAAHIGWRDLMIARAEELRKSQRSMILLWMDGGPSQFESFNPKPGSKNQGPAKTIKTKLPGIDFAEFWPNVASVADKISFIRSMRSGEADHFRAIKLVRAGYPINPTIAYPTWGSVIAMERYNAAFELPAFVRIGKPRIRTRDINAGVLGAKYESFKIDQPGTLPSDVVPRVPTGVLKRRLSLADALDSEFARTGADTVVQEKKDIYDRTSRFVTSPRLNVFSLDDEPEKLRDDYGRTTFGQGCLLARRLVESGVSFVEVFSHGSKNDAGWDTHGNGFRDTPNLCGESDPAFAALIRDLEQRGLLENTLVVWMGEFGRTPKIKKDGGRDHYAKGWLTALAGGGIQPGRVIGTTDKDGVDVTERPVSVPDLYMTFCHSLGIQHDKEYVTAENQPLKLVAEGGKPVKELL